MVGSSRRDWFGCNAAAVALAMLGHVWPSRVADAASGRVGPKRTLHVGPARDIKTVREASERARDGDLILVDAGEYRGDVAVWRQRDIVIRANAGQVAMVAAGASAEDKGTFVFRGTEARVEGISFFGARSRDRNGAGIRLDVGSHLTVSRCRFEDNENGILTSNDAPSELHVIDSEFVGNGAGDGKSHNLYVGSIGKLSVTGCYSARARIGHLLKTRARESVIAYSRLTGEEGTSSYEIEFPSGGRAVIVGCLVQQGPRSENSAIISFGAEGYRWERNELHVSFSTIVNDRPNGGTFVAVASGPARVEVIDNVLVGPGTMDIRVAEPTIRNNEAKRSEFVDAGRLDYRLRRSSALIGASGMVGALGPGRTRPEREYVHPARSAPLERYTPITAVSPGAFQRLAP